MAEPIEEGRAAGASPEQDQEKFDLLARLEAAEQRAREAEEALRAQQTSGAGLRYRPEDAPFQGELGGYLIRVGPRHPDKFKHLPIEEIHAVDESEAIRWYCMTHQNPEGSGKRVDPVNVPIAAKCLDPKRARAIQRVHQLAALRMKVAAGANLSAEEKRLLAANEAEVFGLPVPAEDN